MSTLIRASNEGRTRESDEETTTCSAGFFGDNPISTHPTWSLPSTVTRTVRR